jgi:streptogramin lyase
MLSAPLVTRTLLTTMMAVGLVACESRTEDGTDTMAADTASASTAAAVDSGFSLISTIAGFSAPEAARYDGEQDVWFVSNINGMPSEEDNNGFISRVRPNGTIDSLHFIAGGRGGVTLNAPKGMVLAGDTLWVADIGVARAFNARTGASIGDVTAPGATMLNDLALGPDGAVYITDTGLKFGQEGAQPQASRIYRITGMRASRALESASLQGPNGIAWDGARNAFIIGSFLGDSLFSWAPGDSMPRGIAGGAGQWDGVAVLSDGRVLVSSWADSSLNVLDGRTLRGVLGGLNGPAGIGVDPERMQVAIPSIPANEVRLYHVPGR